MGLVGLLRLVPPEQTPQTIPIVLPSGEPHGIRIAEITTRIVQVMTSGTQPG